MAKPAIKPGVRAAEPKELAPPPGPHLLVVSVKSQKVSLYANGKLVSESPVSTGTPANPTPHGIFSVIQKNRHHRSNIYDGAPMPYMQRLTWSGIALHQGALPGRPASHGCIRLPEKFADYLWRTTKLGARVVIASEDVEPVDIVHAKLFQPKAAPNTVETTPPLRRTLDTTTPPLVRTAGIVLVASDAETDGEPIGSTSEPADSASDPKDQDVAEPDASSAPGPAQQESLAPKPQFAAEPAKADTTASINPQPAAIPDDILDSFVQSLQAKQKTRAPTGPISVFISRKEKRLFVRQGFVPLFSSPVTFRDPKGDVGTHIVTAYNGQGEDGALRWMAVTLPPELPKGDAIEASLLIDASARRAGMPTRSQTKPHAPTVSGPNLATVLDGIDIPQETVDRIADYVTPGASLIVSDQGLGNETGLYTDFIVVTR